ncbi:hypothetical protein BC938DRAFT_481537 [Jimgerdemannia flammicorona]|uniref:Uncharacterized protein n=1 Tax=Jimgerdemannia flammicorona TaxID=994334 RepID=A0A433QFW9_9FUNG|nr:hypothetical protein BC938DRAFT_481537 [Jimgerdemannia flammicorona]
MTQLCRSDRKYLRVMIQHTIVIYYYCFFFRWTSVCQSRNQTPILRSLSQKGSRQNIYTAFSRYLTWIREGDLSVKEVTTDICRKRNVSRGTQKDTRPYLLWVIRWTLCGTGKLVSSTTLVFWKINRQEKCENTRT